MPQVSEIVVPPQEIVIRSGLAYIISAALGVAVKLRLPDLIGEGEQEVTALAKRSNSDPDAVYRILRALEMAGLVTESSNRSFVLTDAGQLLRVGTPGSMHGLIEWLTDPMHLELYSHLRRSVETGATTFDQVHGEPFFKWVSKPENTVQARVFNDAMTSFSEVCTPAFLDAYDFSQFQTLIDIAGGHGAILRAILRQNPQMRGVLAEMAEVLPQSRSAIEADGLADRCKAVACDFFTAIPEGGDGYFMKHIIHDWNDDKAGTILKNIRKVIPSSGKLILAEAVIPSGDQPHPGKLIDLEMLVFVGGKERSEDEFRTLLAASGFEVTQIIDNHSPLSLIEALPV
jgi:predicted transcriptional regulator